MRESGGDSEDREGSTREWRQGRKEIRGERGGRGDGVGEIVGEIGGRERERVGKEWDRENEVRG